MKQLFFETKRALSRKFFCNTTKEKSSNATNKENKRCTEQCIFNVLGCVCHSAIIERIQHELFLQFCSWCCVEQCVRRSYPSSRVFLLLARASFLRDTASVVKLQGLSFIPSPGDLVVPVPPSFITHKHINEHNTEHYLHFPPCLLTYVSQKLIIQDE